MVAPNYDTDLIDMDLAEDDTDWSESSGHKSGGSPAFDQDYFIQGTGCVSQATGTGTGTTTSILYSSPGVLPFKAEDCFFGWHVLLAGNATDVFNQGGMRWYMGSADGDWYGYKVGGRDFGRNPYGGWQNTAVWPTLVGDFQEGTPGGALQYFASIPNLITQISKGNLAACDALRYGRGSLIVSGGSLGDGHCTFAGMSAENDLIANRWGLFQEQAGGFLFKGKMTIGIGHDVTADPSSAAFIDSNAVITIDETPRTFRDFNKIEFNNTGSFVSWDNVLCSAVSAGINKSLSKGVLEVVDNPAGKGNGLFGLNFESCVFTDMFEFIFKSNCTLNNTTWRRCGLITQDNANFDGCLVDEPSGAIGLLSDDLEDITNCDFVSKGTGHAIELTDAHIQGGSYTHTGNTYDGFATVSGGTRNESIYNNSGNLITLLVVGGNVPTVRNGAGANTQIIVATTYTLTGIVSGSEVQIVTQDALDDGTVNPDEDLYHLENTTVDDGSGRGTTQATYAYNYTTDIPIYVYVHKLGYEWTRVIDTLTNTNKSVPVSQSVDRVYDNPV